MSIATQLNKSSWKIWGPLKGPKAGWGSWLATEAAVAVAEVAGKLKVLLVTQ